METPVLGKIIEGEAFRDAIHIAIAPVISGGFLLPGEHVGIIAGTRDIVGRFGEPIIGIVDPFLEYPVKQGEKFYLFLYPNTITSLRHSWTHPAFKAKPLVEDEVKS